MREQLDIFLDGFIKVTKHLILAFVILFFIKRIASSISSFILDVVFEDPLLYLLIFVLGIIFIGICYVVGYENKTRE